MTEPLAERPGAGEPFERIMNRVMARRAFLKGAAAGPILVALPTALPPRGAHAGRRIENNRLTFTPIAPSNDDDVIVPDGYTADIVIRWGDSLFDDTDDMAIAGLTGGLLLEEGAAEKQARRFGYNCDLNVFFPLAASRHGIIAVNHEYANPALMFPDYPEEFGPEAPIVAYMRRHPEAVRVLKAAHGMSLIEIRQEGGRWHSVKGSPYNRRITADTEIAFAGPAAGHDLLKTAGDATGTRVLGMLNNCAGGRTPWGTVLTCEENFDRYFGRAAGLEDPALRRHHERIAPREGAGDWAWEEVDPRFDVSRHPTEAFRFGWVVEIDPYDPGAVPIKRTALGRFKHEGAATVIAKSGQAVVYSGDDARFEYVYKFVSDGRFDAGDRRANRALLDSGTLFAGRFNEDGTGAWLPLDVARSADLQKEFGDQGTLLIDARRAGDMLGATPMDRPEDIEVNPATGKIYVALTNNSRRIDTSADAANPRAPNLSGHVIEISEDGTHTATTFRWEIFLLCGDPLNTEGTYLTSREALDALPLGAADTYFGGWSDADGVSPIGAPDNLAFDGDGNLWIASDGSGKTTGKHDGFFVVPVEGASRGHLRQFLSVPTDAEACGPELTPDGRTLFCNIQHPGDSGSISGTKGGDPPPPSSDWPDRNGLPPRPSLIAVTKDDGGKIGT